MVLSLQGSDQQIPASLWSRDSPTWTARGLEGSDSILLEFNLEIIVVT